MWGGLDVPHDDYNPDGARRLLASLGWRDQNGDGTLEDTAGHPVGFALSVGTGNPAVAATANFIRDDLAKVGLKVTLALMDFNTVSASVNQTINTTPF